MRACTYYQEFAKPKVIWKKTSFRPAFLSDHSATYLGNTLHFIPTTAPWLAPIMNSVIMEFIMVLSINLLRGGYIELTPTRIDSLPIPHLNENEMEDLGRLAENASSNDIAAEGKIDDLIGSAFSLRSKDVELIGRYLALRWSIGSGVESEEPEEA